MSQTIASALDNRVLTFVNIDNDFDCVICMNVADSPVRCSGLCAGIFCDGCMRQALVHNSSCPSCKKANITAPKDVVLRNMIMKHHVYCPNKSNGWTTIKTNRKQKEALNQKCKWIGKYDEISTHMKQCSFEIVACCNEGCVEKTERHELVEHLQVCKHRTEVCYACANSIKSVAMLNHLKQCPKVDVSCECGFECTRDSLTAHRDRDCPLVEIECHVIGCNAKMMRGDYEKHQEQSASIHVIHLSAALIKCLDESKQESTRRSLELSIVKQENARLDRALKIAQNEIVVVKEEVERLAALVRAEIAAKPRVDY